MMPGENQIDLINQQFQALIKEYPDLNLKWGEGSSAEIFGRISFVAKYFSVTIQDEYQIKFLVSEEFPHIPPEAWETGGKIRKSYHHLFKDGRLCVGVETEVRRLFRKNPTLINYVEKILIPYLFSYSYYEQYRRMPYGDRSHGEAGIVEFYKELFKVGDLLSLLGFLKILAENNYRGHHKCPCCSGHKLRSCHGPLLLEMLKEADAKEYLEDFETVLKHAQRIIVVPKDIFPNKTRVKKVLKHQPNHSRSSNT